MISKFRLKFGRATGQEAESIQTTPVTVFVGPNNSGKSKVLSEIYEFCCSGQRNMAAVILDELTFSDLSEQEAKQAIERIQQPPNTGEILNIDHVIIGSRIGRQQVPLRNLINSL